MKISFTTSLLAIACLTASAHAYAQSTMRANIPFEFMVGQKVLPPGQYSISHVTDTVIELSNWEKNARMFVSASPTDYVSQKPYVLVFNEYGNQYFLHEVRGGVGELSLDISPSKLEKERQRQEAAHRNQQSTEIALK